MLPQRTGKARPKRTVRFPGITELAAASGVTREHIYRVLTGERRSPHAGKWRMILNLNKRRAA